MNTRKLNLGLKAFLKSTNVWNLRVNWALVFVIVFILAIVQDYVFSELKNTGFYLSESALYNTLWLLFIPGLRLMDVIKKRNPSLKMHHLVALAMSFAVLHLLIFALGFYLISCILFEPHHLFMTMLKSCVASYLFVTIFAYALLPKLVKRKKHPSSTFLKEITVKQGHKTYLISVSEVLYIQTERPYLAIHTAKGKKLYSSSLAKLARQLDPKVYLQVHRSTIINRHCIIKLVSRKNGDYDAELSSGQSLRLSRHYKDNWEVLLKKVPT